MISKLFCSDLGGNIMTIVYNMSFQCKLKPQTHTDKKQNTFEKTVHKKLQKLWQRRSVLYNYTECIVGRMTRFTLSNRRSNTGVLCEIKGLLFPIEF